MCTGSTSCSRAALCSRATLPCARAAQLGAQAALPSPGKSTPVPVPASACVVLTLYVLCACTQTREPQQGSAGDSGQSEQYQTRGRNHGMCTVAVHQAQTTQDSRAVGLAGGADSDTLKNGTVCSRKGEIGQFSPTGQPSQGMKLGTPQNTAANKRSISPPPCLFTLGGAHPRIARASLCLRSAIALHNPNPVGNNSTR